MRKQVATPDLMVADIAAGQHGVVAHRQLRAAGLSVGGIDRRVQAGRLHRVHRGVYAVGYCGLTHERKWMAAALACGVGAIVSHRSAAALWGLLAARDGPVDISIPGDRGGGKHTGIRLHRSRSLIPALTTRRHNIPVTTPARTIADLRRVASAKELRRAVRQVDALGLPIETEATPDRTRSELEWLFTRLCRRYRLPPPEVNVRIDAWEVDFLWRVQQLIVETDGYQYHRGRVAFEDDRRRDLELRARGYEVIRLTHHQVIDHPEQVGRILKELLEEPRRRA